MLQTRTEAGCRTFESILSPKLLSGMRLGGRGYLGPRRHEHWADFNEFANAAQLGLYWVVLNEIPQTSRVPPEAGVTLWLTLSHGATPNHRHNQR
jgi:hypothetical protein